MKTLIRTTLTGALVFLLPIGILAFFVGKIIKVTHALVQPLSDQLPVKTVGGISATILVSLLAIIAVSFLAGLLAQSRVARGIVEQMETHLLSRVPAYGLLKSLSNDVIAPGEQAEHPVVLVRFDDAWQLGVLIGEANEGTHRVVFLPDSPTPQSGAVMIMEAARVQVTDIPLTRMFSGLSARGMGLGEMVRLPKPAA